MELSYPLGAAARLSGVSPALIRAWESRYRAVVPARTEGGSRRYTAADIERLRLLKAAADAGHRIGQVAQLANEALRERIVARRPETTSRLDEILRALDELEGSEAQRMLSIQLYALGPARFARECAMPLLREIGERWSQARMGIPSEHLATAILRSLLGSALQPTAATMRGPRIVFATPTGEPHELGLLMAALTALGGGADPLYLGAGVPVDDLVAVVERAGAAALALGLVTIEAELATRTTHALRRAIPDHVHLWIGGAGVARADLPDRVECFASLEALEQRVSLLCFEPANDR